jgi:hypothetical protein
MLYKGLTHEIEIELTDKTNVETKTTEGEIIEYTKKWQALAK